MADRPELKLLPESGEIPADAPATYAAALDEIAALRADRERLITENQELAQSAGRLHAQVRRVQGEKHKQLHFHKDYETVQRLWDEVWKPHHPRAGERPPEDWARMALDRLKDFDEAQLARALYGAIHNPGTNSRSGEVYDQWDNALRSTGHVHRHIQYADLHEGRAHRERERHPDVARVLADLGVATFDDLGNRCDNCGELMILHRSFVRPGPLGIPACGDPDDVQFRFDRSERRREGGR